MKPCIVLLVVIAELTSVENRAMHRRSSPPAYDTTLQCREVTEGSQRYLECDGNVAASFARKHGSQLGQMLQRFFFPQPIDGGFVPLPPFMPPCPYPSTTQPATPTPKPTVPPTATYRPTLSTATTVLPPETTITPTPPTKPTQVPGIPPIPAPGNGFTNYNPVVLSLNVNNNCNSRDKTQGAEEGTTTSTTLSTTRTAKPDTTSKPTVTTTEEPTKTTTPTTPAITATTSKPTTTSTPTSTTEEIIQTTVKPTVPHLIEQQVRNNVDEVIVKLYRQAPSTRIEPEKVCSDKDLRKCLSKLAKANRKKQSRSRSGGSKEDNKDH